MRRFFAVLLPLILGTFTLGAHQHHRGHSADMNISIDDDTDIADCGDVRVRFDSEPASTAEEDLPAAAGLTSLKVNTPHNGGVRVLGGDSAGYSIRVCKAAALASQLASIRPHLNGNVLSADGPDSDQWTVYFLVQAPRNAVLDLQTNNGGISVRNVIGSITARATNGPVSIAKSSGTIDANSENGPIDFTGNAGNVKLRAQNGPVSVKLSGGSFSGSLDAGTQNGPLSLRLPRDYRSGVLLESDGHSPISCHAMGCKQSQSWSRDVYTDDDDEDDDHDEQPRQIRLGSGTTVIHLSTVNGPVSVKER